MKVNEIICEDREMLDEGIKDLLKKVGLGVLLSVSMAAPAHALDVTANDLVKMGMSRAQATAVMSISNDQIRDNVIARYQKLAKDPAVAQQLKTMTTTTAAAGKTVDKPAEPTKSASAEKIKSEPSINLDTAKKDKEEIKKTVSQPVVDKDTGYYKQVDPAYIKNPFGDLLKGSGWELAPSGEMAKLKVLDAKTIPGNPNLMAVLTTSVWGVKQLTGGKYKGLYVRGEPEQVWGVRIYDRNTGAEYLIKKDYAESDADSVKKFFDSGNFNIGKNLNAHDIEYGLRMPTGPGGFQAPYFNQAKNLLK